MHNLLRELTIDVNEASDLEVVESHDNSHKGWLVMTIRCEDRDSTEHVSNLAKRHGFDLCWVDFEEQTICLNQKVS